MTTIKIDTQSDVDWISFNDVIDLECVVIKGNRDYKTYEEPQWWKDAKEYVSDLNCYDESAAKYWDKLSREQKKAIIKEYNEWDGRNEDAFMINIVNILCPNINVKQACIHGYCQGEWQNVIYEEGAVDIELLETVYFGQLADITVENGDECMGDWITDYDLWKAKWDGDLKEFFRKRYDLDANEEIKVFQSDGFIQTIKWKEVC